jgi:hypothetical protein
VVFTYFGGHSASSGNSIVYRISPQRQPPVILRGGLIFDVDSEDIFSLRSVECCVNLNCSFLNDTEVFAGTLDVLLYYRRTCSCQGSKGAPSLHCVCVKS